MVIDVGAGIALGILIDTFVVLTLLVPSTVALLGRWNWRVPAGRSRREANGPGHRVPGEGRQARLTGRWLVRRG
jgi:uncharacterized membrane protein YdfJ with MMPL/SSD domain